MRSYSAEQVTALGPGAAIEALRAALVGGLDPEAEPPRTSTPFGSGELLTMPATSGRFAGVKLATIAPQGRPRIHAVYVLFDAVTLAPVATVDGSALTALRTPAVAALGVDLVAPHGASDLVVFGTGPQAYGHVHALRAVRPVGRVRIVGRSDAHPLVQRLRDEGVPAELAEASAVRDADLIACCTTARTPLFAGSDLRDGVVVVACGSHEPDAREVDTQTVVRCGGAVVEAVSAARREAGDVILAEADGVDVPLVTLGALARGETTSRPRFVKTVGMGWQDLVVASVVASAVASAVVDRA